MMCDIFNRRFITANTYSICILQILEIDCIPRFPYHVRKTLRIQTKTKTLDGIIYLFEVIIIVKRVYNDMFASTWMSSHVYVVITVRVKRAYVVRERYKVVISVPVSL